jgi:hypothetical protein
VDAEEKEVHGRNSGRGDTGEAVVAKFGRLHYQRLERELLDEFGRPEYIVVGGYKWLGKGSESCLPSSKPGGSAGRKSGSAPCGASLPKKKLG